MRVSDFDFDLPPDRIALRPEVPRERAKLLVVGRGLLDFSVGDLPSQLRAGDILVFNNTRVIPAALSGYRVGRLGTAPKIEVLLHMRVDQQRWRAFARPAKKLLQGDCIQFGDLHAVVEEKSQNGEIALIFDKIGSELDAGIARVGRMPLPPYIESRRAQDEQDRSDYQTVFAKELGAVAAPTAGLHFTQELINKLQHSGIDHEFVTLHVGAGTFLPIKTERTEDHQMHSEWGQVSQRTIERLQQARAKGGRIVAVGTTSLRILEANGLNPFAGETKIFITPGHVFKAVDGLITNFHLPRSTLFMLVCAFAGMGRMKNAYAHAIRQQYRFYSYGDASLLWPEHD